MKIELNENPYFKVFEEELRMDQLSFSAMIFLPLVL